MTEIASFVVDVPICKPCPVCGEMPILCREFNHMHDAEFVPFYVEIGIITSIRFMEMETRI